MKTSKTEVMKNKRMVKVLRTDGTYTIEKKGLWEKEREVLNTMFSEDKKSIIKFEKLTNLQKKVLRKMNFNKQSFLN